MRSDGSEFPVELTVARVEGAGGLGPSFYGFVRDIGERRRGEEQLAYLAYHDALTGLPNRILVEQEIDLALARARRAGGGRRADVRRPRRLQGGQRPARPRRRRPAAGQRLGTPAQRPARLRCSGPAGRRRVPGPARRPVRRPHRGGRERRREAARRAARAVRRGRDRGPHGRQHRRQPVPGRRGGHRGAAASRRRRHVSGQGSGRRPPRLPSTLRHSGLTPLEHGRPAAQRARRRRDGDPLPASVAAEVDPRRSPGWRRCCAGATPTGAC